jgi:hypothetical protein
MFGQAIIHSRHQYVRILSGIFLTRQIAGVERNPVARIEEAIDAWSQYALETAIAVQQSTLAVADYDFLYVKHGTALLME